MFFFDISNRHIDEEGNTHIYCQISIIEIVD